MKKYSSCPSWLRLSADRTEFILLQEDAEIVRRIFELSIGGLGSYTIAKQFNRQGVRTFGSSKKWDHTNIDNLLRNRATLGEHQPKDYSGGSKKGVPTGTPITGYYPAVIDEKTFVAAKEARQNHLRSGRGRKGTSLANLFTGLTKCVYCGDVVQFHSNGSYKSLICTQVLARTNCVRAGWSYLNFEDSVLQFLCHPALTDDGDYLGEIRQLTGAMRKLQTTDPVDIRLELASKLKQSIIELRLASAGSNPTPFHQDALIRRDHPNRFFKITLQDGRTYEGMPIPARG
jgi:hypothetical protein